MHQRLVRHPIVAMAALAALLCGCERSANGPPPAPSPDQANTPAPAPAPTVSAPSRLSRQDLIKAADRAASAVAAGLPYPPEVTELSGREFTVRLPFGCAGAGQTGPARYSMDSQTNTVRFTAEPETWAQAPFAMALLPSGAEAVEGFWVRRPWLLTESCPAGPNQAAPPSPETLGLAQVFDAAGSRLSRRGKRGYEATVRLRPGQEIAPGGLRLVLSGRLASDGGPPIRCRQESIETRPMCLIFVGIDRVAFEDTTGQVFAEWTG